MRRVIAVTLGLVLLSVIGPTRVHSEDKPKRGDGRVGVVLDLKGAAFVRPVGRDRWSRLAARSILEPGDLVRTSVHGAHAIEIALGGGRKLLLGPNALAEIPEVGTARLLRGEAEAIGTKDAPLALLGPGDFRRELPSSLAVRAEIGRIVVLAEPPRWVTGYRDSTTDEWMGSLVAQVDGRVGYTHLIPILDAILVRIAPNEIADGCRSRKQTGVPIQVGLAQF